MLRFQSITKGSAAAVLLYGGLAAYLYHPYFSQFRLIQYALIINPVLAGLGCFILSKRWTNTFYGAFFAGAIYGFGGFAISLGLYHPFGGLIFAALPWFFYPVVFFEGENTIATAGLKLMLTLLPFLLVAFFFEAAASLKFFPIPVSERLVLANLCGLFSGVPSNGGSVVISFYHAPLAALVMGIFAAFSARRILPIAIAGTGLVLAVMPPVFQVSPIFWISVPVMCCAILIGFGMESFAWAGKADRGWLLIITVITLVLAMVTFFAVPNRQIATAYLFSAGVIGMIFLITSLDLRLHWLRWIMLCGIFGADILLGSRAIVDSLF